jgi:hypothetical protein
VVSLERHNTYLNDELDGFLLVNTTSGVKWLWSGSYGSIVINNAVFQRIPNLALVISPGDRFYSKTFPMNVTVRNTLFDTITTLQGRGGALTVSSVASLLVEHVTIKNSRALTGAAMTIRDVFKTIITKQSQFVNNHGDGHSFSFTTTKTPEVWGMWMIVSIDTDTSMQCIENEVGVMIDGYIPHGFPNETIWQCVLGTSILHPPLVPLSFFLSSTPSLCVSW